MKTYSRTLGAILCASALTAPACSEVSTQAAAQQPNRVSAPQASNAPAPQIAPAALAAPATSLPAPQGAWHEAFDLLVNRPLGHRAEGPTQNPTFVLDAGTHDFVRYIHGNHPGDWLLRVDVDKVRAAALKGRTARLWTPHLASEGEQALVLRVYNPAAGQNSLQIKLNGHALEATSLLAGWQTITVAVPAAARIAPENRLELTFSNLGRINGVLSGGAIAWLRSGPAAEIAQLQGEPAALTQSQDRLGLAPNQGASWTVWLNQGAQLHLNFEAPAGCGPEVRLEGEDGKGGVKQLLSEDRLTPSGVSGTQKTFVDLAAHAGQVARLGISAPASCTAPLDLARAALMVPGEKPALPEVKPPKYVLFWVIDTLRADYLPIHFETDVEAPNLKRLAAEGASFKNAYVQGTESRASHATLFTGQYPDRHKVMAKGKVSPATPVLSEEIRKAGYKTLGNASNGYLSHLLGLNRGWDVFVNNIHTPAAVDGMTMAQTGLKWAREHKAKPFMLYIGTIDPHVTYRRHQDLIARYDPKPYSGRFEKNCSGEDLGLIKARKLAVTARDRERIIALYKNEVTFNDRAFGFLRAQLEAEGIWQDTLVVITADHGEEFWEHGSVGHGHNVHQEMVHVPLIFYYPAMIPPGTVVDAGAEVTDVFPTVMQLLGRPAPAGMQGKSLLPIIHKQHGGYPEPAIATQYQLHYGVQLEHWKLYLRRNELQVYDRRTDPLELKDIAQQHPLATRWLLDTAGWFRAHREGWEKETWGVANKLAPAFTSKLKN